MASTRKGRSPRTRSTDGERREAVLGLAGQPGPEHWARIVTTGIRHYGEPGSVAE
jgi:hypothetical protein